MPTAFWLCPAVLISCVASKLKTCVKHLYNVGPTSKTLDRRCANALCLLGNEAVVFKYKDGEENGTLILGSVYSI